jgi:diguanylate cyclase (GGDEF)-like protein
MAARLFAASTAPHRAGASPARQLLSAASRNRFRAATRRRLRSSTRAAMWLVALASTINAAWLIPAHPHRAGLLFVVDCVIVGAALSASWLLARFRHLSAELVMLAVLLIVDATISGVIGFDAPVALLCAGYLLLLPPFVALLVPWSVRLHLTWLLAHGLAGTLLAERLPPEAVAVGGPRTLLTLLVVASLGSVLGHLLNLRARLTSFHLIEQVRFMNREVRRDELALRQLNARLELVVWTDQLTGFGNRLALQRELATIRSRIERRGDEYALLMLDIDHFKAINDRLGHFAGDAVLQLVAGAIGSATRAGDATFRFGGEEFVTVVALGEPGEASVIAERIRVAVQDLAVSNPANQPFGVVTVSIGSRLVGAEHLTQPDDQWLQDADAALYRAKREGRNRVVAASPGRPDAAQPEPVATP